jgi:hypothetical protein
MATLSSAAIKDTLSKYGQLGGQGAAARLRRTATGHPQAPAVQKQFINDVANAPVVRQVAYPHPGRPGPAAARANSSASPLVAGQQEYEKRHAKGNANIPDQLSDADIAWLTRLPSDPSAVTLNDAKVAIAMKDRTLSPDQARLVSSVVDPLLEYHDHQAALVDLSNAQQPVLPLPMSAVPALAHAISVEIPQLTADEAVGRAHAVMEKIASDRAAAQSKRLQQANTDLAAVKQRVADRTATAGPTVVTR